MFSWFTAVPPAFRDDLTIVGDRVQLRPLRLSDDQAMYVYASDPEVTQFLPWEPAPHVDAVRPFLQDQMGRRKRCESLAFAIVLQSTGEMIGSTDLMDLRRSRGEGELGYLIAKPFWGLGLMTEAAGMTLRYGFEALNLSRAIAYADCENVGSCRVLTKIGMTFNRSEARFVKAEPRSYHRFEITRAQWDNVDALENYVVR